MEPHPHPHLARDEHLLTLCRSGQRRDRIREGVQERVPLRIDLDAAVSGERGAQKTAVPYQRIHVARLTELFDQSRRALDISE